MQIPTNLKHKPVIISENYENVDGRNAYKSDAKGLSLGLAQWNDRGKVDISAKVWRHTGGKWSRQSEELPLHRVLDLALFVCRAKQHFKEAYRNDVPFDADNPIIDRVGLQGDAMTIRFAVENEMLTEDIALFERVLSENDELLSERLIQLASVLRDMGY